jgi:hypothetical protein
MLEPFDSALVAHVLPLGTRTLTSRVSNPFLSVARLTDLLLRGWSSDCADDHAVEHSVAEESPTARTTEMLASPDFF